MSIEVVEFEGVRVAAVRHVGPYDQIKSAFMKLGQIAGPAGLFAHEGVRAVGVYHDNVMVTPAEELRSDAGVVLLDGVEVPAGLELVELGSGRYARYILVGSYDGIAGAWQELVARWLPASGEQMGAAPCFEIYLNSPQDTPAEELETHLYLALG